MEYARPSVDNLINNLPSVLKSSRQFIGWKAEGDGRKVPLKPDGRSSWGNYMDPACWRTFEEAIDLVDRGRAFGIGLVLPSAKHVNTLPEFNLISGLVALDADAKRSPLASAYKIPANVSDVVRSMRSYSEFSTSLKGLRGLVFGLIPTSNQNVTHHFGDGTELSLYRGGWVTLSGLAYPDSPATIEHRQQVLDELVAEFWPSLLAPQIPQSALRPAVRENLFALDWSRTASEEMIRGLIEGKDRTPEQRRRIIATWELKRGWNHGNTPDSSMYTKRIVEEALWLRSHRGWTVQDVVDIVITFCKKHQLHWSPGRAKRQIADGLARISNRTCQRAVGGVVDSDSHLLQQTPPPTLTCKDSQIIREQTKPAEAIVTGRIVIELHEAVESKSPDSLGRSNRLADELKLSAGFRNKSAVRDAVLQAINNHPGWVKLTTVAAETDMSAEAVRKQLHRLAVAGLVDRDGKGRYRKHRERKQRKLKRCSSKPIPLCCGTNKPRKTLSWSELVKRGWPRLLIAMRLPDAGKDFREKEIVVDDQTGHVVKARFYWVSRIK